MPKQCQPVLRIVALHSFPRPSSVFQVIHSNNCGQVQCCLHYSSSSCGGGQVFVVGHDTIITRRVLSGGRVCILSR